MAEMKIIAHVYNSFPEKFGLPRQSGLVPGIVSRIVFTPDYRVAEALRGIEGYSHLWLIWEFSENLGKEWSPTIRPPRLGGKVRMGVFATRSPLRPNPIGLSCVKLEKVAEESGLGHVLYVSGTDMKDGTPVYDIKPYVPLADCRPEATGGFSDAHKQHCLTVDFPDSLAKKLSAEDLNTLTSLLAQDPRPAYQDDPSKVYGMSCLGVNISFTVKNDVLTVTAVASL